jgi:hypothetical protein
VVFAEQLFRALRRAGLLLLQHVRGLVDQLQEQEGGGGGVAAAGAAAAASGGSQRVVGCPSSRKWLCKKGTSTKYKNLCILIKDFLPVSVIILVSGLFKEKSFAFFSRKVEKSRIGRNISHSYFTEGAFISCDVSST